MHPFLQIHEKIGMDWWFWLYFFFTKRSRKRSELKLILALRTFRELKKERNATSWIIRK